MGTDQVQRPVVGFDPLEDTDEDTQAGGVPRADLLRGLTEREREILELVARGHSNNDIADQLVISPLTAKTHVRNVLHKLDCRDRTALTALAYDTGVITPGDTS